MPDPGGARGAGQFRIFKISATARAPVSVGPRGRPASDVGATNSSIFVAQLYSTCPPKRCVLTHIYYMLSILSESSSNAGPSMPSPAHSLIEVLGATAIACEDESLPAENRMKLISLRTTMVARVAQMCASAPARGVRVSVVINVFSGICSLGTLPPCVLKVTHMPGSKLNFWTSVLTPELTSQFQLVWCFDNDLAVDKFAIGVAARVMVESNISMAQPCIPSARRGQNRSLMRTTDIPHLRCHYKCGSAPTPRRGEVQLGGIRCLLREMQFVEVMTPIFAAHAWVLQHRRLLSTIPRALLVESDRGLSEVWCSFFRETLPDQPACGLLCVRLAHYHGRTIDVSNHSHVRYGSNRTGRKQLPGLIKWSHEAFRRHYLKSAAGWPAARCQLPLNRTSPALSAALPWIHQGAAPDLHCGAGCKRRNRMTTW